MSSELVPIQFWILDILEKEFLFYFFFKVFKDFGKILFLVLLQFKKTFDLLLSVQTPPN